MTPERWRRPQNRQAQPSATQGRQAPAADISRYQGRTVAETAIKLHGSQQRTGTKNEAKKKAPEAETV